jgi:hypothetical protein
MEVTKTVHSRMKVTREVQRQWMERRRKMRAKRTLIKREVSALCVCVYLQSVLNLRNLNTSHSEPLTEKYIFVFYLEVEFCNKQPPIVY